MVKKMGLVFFTLVFLGILLMVFANVAVAKAGKGKTFNSEALIPKHKVGVVLGTSKYFKGGGLNSYFQNRMDAAETLYKAGKIEFILVSGDNGTLSYNEPQMMKKELIKRGIPEEVIFLDYAGFRTLDSVVRAKEIFGLLDVVFISQRFHNERAIYIAGHHGIDAIGFNAKDMDGVKKLRMQIREYLARTKAFLDIVFNVEPKFYGEPIQIE